MSKQSKADRDNTANQQNPNNDSYWQSRGEAGRPEGGSDESSRGPASPPAPATSPGTTTPK
ncbi:MAG: hypothetical protein JWO36_5856 [Myxococcales bacterium]|nr:hypothetical protein [Myxococcales bacterium]